MSRISLYSAVLALMLIPSGCASNNAPRTAPLVGAWRSSVQFDAGAFAEVKDLEFMYAFHADGTMTESSNYDAAPPVPPAYGAWRETGPSEFEAKYEYFATTPSAPDAFKTGAGWLPSGRGVLTERIKISDDGDTFTSTLTYEMLDPQGKPAAGGGTAKGRAVRIRP
ncbi:MAG TPA: hypothetical protein VFS09_10350 [Candidatus Eisenbacteria bacterium]|nr:hypothetical protein [Candidatus Eisenbacteria bacterium]